MAALSAALLVFRHGLKTTDPRTVLGLKMLSSSLSAGKSEFTLKQQFNCIKMKALYITV